MKEEKPKLKEIRYSWLLRISLPQFYEMIKSIRFVIDNVLGETDYMIESRQRFMESSGKMVMAEKIQRGHKNTEIINELHSEQKNIVTFIKTIARHLYTNHNELPITHPTRIVSEWISKVGKRHYDLGIGKLTEEIMFLKKRYDKNEAIRDAVEELNLTKKVKKLFSNFEEINRLITQRDIDISGRYNNELRREEVETVYKDLARFLKLFNESYEISTHPELHYKLQVLLYRRVNPARASYLRRETMRKKRKAREKEKADELSNKTQLYDEGQPPEDKEKE